MTEKPEIILKLKGSLKVPWKSLLFGTQQLFAFQTPATIKLPSGKSKLNFSGEIQGNFRKGDLTLKDVNVWLEKFGKIFVFGRLVKWGTEVCEIEGNVKDFAIDELRNILGIQNLPFSAAITGKLSVSINKDIVKLLKFDIDFSNLMIQQQSSPLQGHVKGTYDILEKKCIIDSGNITTKSGGKIFVKGMISSEDFSLKIESTGVNLEEIISQLPQKWQEKLKISSESKISISAEGFRSKEKVFPEFTGFLSIPGDIQYKNLSCSALSIKSYPEKNEILIEAQKVGIGRINCNEIKGKISRENEKYRGNINFSFYNGTGNVHFVTTETQPLKIYAKAEVSRMDLAMLVQSLSPEILITGIINIICFFEFGDKEYSLMAKFDNVPGRPFSQKLNIGAVKAIANLGSANFASSMGKQFGSGNFYYRRLGGVISIVNGLLTIEGTAKRAKGNDFLVTSEIFGSGINVLVDKNNNSIQIEDLKQRISRAMKQGKPQFKLSLIQQGERYGNNRINCGKQIMLS
ncbi:MAG: hypothetical protein NC913_07360 [Candidatus Omnitrophica bacterium]|nr:hypothetical protein [Candidatus Omnitrophota bacterium]